MQYPFTSNDANANSPIFDQKSQRRLTTVWHILQACAELADNLVDCVDVCFIRGRRRGWSKQQVCANGDDKKEHYDDYNEVAESVRTHVMRLQRVLSSVTPVSIVTDPSAEYRAQPPAPPCQCEQ